MKKKTFLEFSKLQEIWSWDLEDLIKEESFENFNYFLLFIFLN